MKNSLKEYIHNLRLNGSIINKMILISAAHGIDECYNRSLLKKYGGCLELSHTWVQSFMSSLGFVKRKGMKAVRKLPVTFLLSNYCLWRKLKILLLLTKPLISLVFNRELTGLKLVPQVTGPWLKWQ